MAEIRTGKIMVLVAFVVAVGIAVHGYLTGDTNALEKAAVCAFALMILFGDD